MVLAETGRCDPQAGIEQTFSASAFTTRTGFTCKWCAEDKASLGGLPEHYLRLMDEIAALRVTNYALEHSLRELLEEYHSKECWTDEHIEYEMQQGNMMAPIVKRAYTALHDAIRTRGEKNDA
jgi:hypothetical protein